MEYTDAQERVTGENTAVTAGAATTESTAKLVYILYLIGLFISPVGIVGVIMAYINRSDVPEWLQSHYRFQIRTFWIGGFYLLLGILTSVVLIGYLILLFWAVWLIVRCAKGMKALDLKQAHPNPAGWLF